MTCTGGLHKEGMQPAVVEEPAEMRNVSEPFVHWRHNDYFRLIVDPHEFLQVGYPETDHQGYPPKSRLTSRQYSLRMDPSSSSILRNRLLGRNRTRVFGDLKSAIEIR